jgi:hexosaminidase
MIKTKLNLALTTIIVALLLVVQASCTTKTPSDLSKESIIPKPVSIISTGDYFTLKAGSVIFIQGESVEIKKIGQFLADRLNPSSGLGIEVKSTNQPPTSGNIYLTLSGADEKLGEEGYELIINKNMVKLSARGAAGLFRGIQTIRQILPPNIELLTKTGWSMENSDRDYY